jgi:hypothetical protein
MTEWPYCPIQEREPPAEATFPFLRRHFAPTSLIERGEQDVASDFCGGFEEVVQAQDRGLAGVGSRSTHSAVSRQSMRGESACTVVVSSNVLSL